MNTDACGQCGHPDCPDCNPLRSLTRNHEPRICIACKWCDRSGSPAMFLCASPRNVHTNLVTGFMQRISPRCSDLRSVSAFQGDICGREGAWFTPLSS